MGIYPKIQSPCPYADRLDQIMVGDHCTKCERSVVDITAMADREREALIAGCETELCVSYSLPVKGAMAAAAMSAALGMAAPAFAAADVDAVADPQTTDAADVATDAEAAEMDFVLIVGGLKEPKRTMWVKARDAQRPAGMAELPVIYDDADSSDADSADQPAAPAKGEIAPAPVTPAS